MLQELESIIGRKLPEYEAFIKKFGTGTYSGVVRVYPPQRILAEYKDFQSRWQKNFFWDGAHSEISPQDLSQAIIFADTIDGDEFVFIKNHKPGFYILPRESVVGKSKVQFLCLGNDSYGSPIRILMARG